MTAEPVPHALADLFPLMAPDDLAVLANDIAASGLRSPITERVNDSETVLLRI